LPLFLGLDADKVKFFSEPSFPEADADLSIVKNDRVARGPNNPIGSNEEFSEDGVSKSLFEHRSPCLREVGLSFR
jgi:hypothetical protein